MDFSADHQVLSDKEVALAVDSELARDISDIFPPKNLFGFGQQSGLETAEWKTIANIALGDILRAQAPIGNVTSEKLAQVQEYLRALERQSALATGKRDKMPLEAYMKAALGNVIAPTIRS